MYTLMVMKRVNIHLPENMLARLKQRARDTGVPVAEQIRRAIQHEIDQDELKREKRRK